MPRLVLPVYLNHVTQRGNRRMKTFFCEDDYLAYTIRRAASTGARQVMAASYFR
jgi:hypothetical protein